MKIPGRIRPWLAPVLITAAVWLLWLPFLAGGSIRFDNDLMISRPDTALSRYISEGRPGLVVLLHVLGLTAFNPLKSALLFLVFFTGAAWLPVLFLRRTGSPGSGRSDWLFVLLCAASPVWAYQFYFTLQLAPVGLGMLLTAGTACLDTFWCMEERKTPLVRVPQMLLSSLLLGLAVSVYQALITHYLAVAAILVFSCLWNGQRIRPGRLLVWVLRVIASVAAYLAIARLLRGGESAYLNNQVLWGRQPVSESLIGLFRQAGKLLVPLSSVSLSLYPVGIILLVLLLRQRRKAGKPLFIITLAGIAVLILPLLMNIVLGGATVPRTQFALQVVAAFLPVFYAAAVPGKHRFLKGLCIAVAVLQAACVIRLWHTDTLRSRQDQAAAREIAAVLEEANPSGKPVLFYGTLPFEDSSVLTEKKDVIGMSFFEWGGYSPERPGYSTPGGVRLLEAVTDITPVPYHYWSIPADLDALVRSMPEWPAEGSVRETEEAVVIRLRLDPEN